MWIHAIASKSVPINFLFIQGGQDAGDEYFAELDYIEVAEQIKEGYESEVEPPEPEDEVTITNYKRSLRCT